MARFGAKLANKSQVLHGLASTVTQTQPDPVLNENVTAAV
jgi:hypothetical protein